MATIQVLDPLLANQIAAGEVVERPASVVKELVENAIDAGAKHISIECQHGGKDKLVVSDDGKGMTKDDLPLACLRHATSKIGDYQDLVHIQSLGFRGEALASIAAVSKLTLTSSTISQDHAWQVHIEGCDSQPELKPASNPVGTRVDVAQLFYNTPARRRFLRTDKTEFNHIETVILRQALSRFDIAFRLTHNDKLIFDMPVANTQELKEQRIAKVFGKDFIEAAVAIDFDVAGVNLTGWVTEPHYNRPQPDQQYAYINGRFIRDKMIMSAVKSAYQDIMFHGRHAAYVLYLSCEPASVDVNVHPTKHEVRFRDGRTEYRFIRQSIRDALSDQRIESPKLAAMPETVDRETGEISTEAPIAPVLSYNQVSRPAQSYSQNSHEKRVLQHPVAAIKQNMQVQQPSLLDDEQAIENPLGVAIAQCHETYILAQNAKGMVVVDMHAAHERVLFEQMKAQVAKQSTPVQQLLVPEVIHLEESEYDTFKQVREPLLELGLDIDDIGNNQLVVRAVPQLLQRSALPQLIKDTLIDVANDRFSDRIELLLHQIMANMACKAAVKANHKMTIPEMNHLLRQMESLPFGGLCNHGRPAWKQFSLGEIDKWFLRGQ